MTLIFYEFPHLKARNKYALAYARRQRLGKAARRFAGVPTVPTVPTVLPKITLEGCTVNSRFSGHAWDFVKCLY